MKRAPISCVDTARRAVRAAIARAGDGPVMVHSDVFGAMRLIEKSGTAREVLARHLHTLEALAESRPLYFPAFSYDFTTTGKADARHDRSQVGRLSEYARTHWADWRDATPVFSFCGRSMPEAYNRLVPEAGSVIDPFDESSLFHRLAEDDGAVLLYGAPISRLTGLHYIEHRAGRPLYRYDKDFAGFTRPMSGERLPVTLRYHVRPRGIELEYDWDHLREVSLEAGVLEPVSAAGGSVAVIAFRGLRELWCELIRGDPLFPLSAASRRAVEPRLEALGRRFERWDFEENSDDGRLGVSGKLNRTGFPGGVLV